MTDYPIDVTYGWAQLGLEPGADLEEIQEVLRYAKACKYATRDRITHVQSFADFFVARSQLGALSETFADIRKAYYKQAMFLHPDRNNGDQESEERLKAINAAYALIEHINRDAKLYYQQSENIRRESEEEARQETAREHPTGKRPPRKPQPATGGQAHTRAANPNPSSARRFMAASILRSVRVARLGYLPVHAIIGSRYVKGENGANIIFDIIMLPEDQFLRAKLHLSVATMANPTLNYGRFNPPYIPQDTKILNIPPHQADPEAFAREHFRHAFGLTTP